MMTFHEFYGHLPMRLLRAYKRFGVSAGDHDQILDMFGYVWQDAETIPAAHWTAILTFVESQSLDGSFRMPYPF